MISTDEPALGLRPLIGRVAKRLEHLGAGPLAELRRLHADAEDRWRSPTFYRIYADTVAPTYAGSPEHERRWAMILAGMARLVHRSGHGAGATLAEHGFAEKRFVRLLDADDDHVASDLRTAVSFLASKGAFVNWADLADLILSTGGDRHDQVRRGIAAAYYRTLAKKV